MVTNSSFPGQEDAGLDVVLGLIRRLTDDIAEVRRQLTENQKSHLTVEELAALVGRAPYTVRSWISDGKVTAIRVSGSGQRGRLLIPRGELQKLIRSGKGSDVPAASLLPEKTAHVLADDRSLAF